MDAPIRPTASNVLNQNKLATNFTTARRVGRRSRTPAQIRRLSASPALRRRPPNVLRRPSPPVLRRRSLSALRRTTPMAGRPLIARPLPPVRMTPHVPLEQKRPYQEPTATINRRVAAARRARALRTHGAMARQMRRGGGGVTSRRLAPGELQARYQRRLLRLVNAERAKYGAPPVKLHETLTACARHHNADLAFLQKRLSHVGADGATLGERLRRSGYPFRYASENIARGQGNPPHVVHSWMQSPGHRKNLLNPRATHMGVHVGRGTDGRLYWAQLFGNLK